MLHLEILEIFEKLKIQSLKSEVYNCISVSWMIDLSAKYYFAIFNAL